VWGESEGVGKRERSVRNAHTHAHTHAHDAHTLMQVSKEHDDVILLQVFDSDMLTNDDLLFEIPLRSNSYHVALVFYVVLCWTSAV
jgi:hypothetical protein